MSGDTYMPKICHYDPKEKVIFIDYSGQTITGRFLAETRAELEEIHQQHRIKVYTITNFEGAKIDPSLTVDDFADHLHKATQIVKGTIRYGKIDPYTNIFLRTTTIQKRYQNLQSHIYH